MKIAWSTVPPQLRDAISMGLDERWGVVKIATYRPETAQDIDTVYLAHVHPFNLPLPPESKWSNIPGTIIDPQRSLYVSITAIGLDELELGAMAGAVTPALGEEIDSLLEPSPDGPIFLDSPKFWVTSRVVPYLAVSEMKISSPELATYAKAFVCWCDPIESGSES